MISLVLEMPETGRGKMGTDSFFSSFTLSLNLSLKSILGFVCNEGKMKTNMYLYARVLNGCLHCVGGTAYRIPSSYRVFRHPK
jgi:hypothetical protein